MARWAADEIEYVVITARLNDGYSLIDLKEANLRKL